MMKKIIFLYFLTVLAVPAHALITHCGDINASITNNYYNITGGTYNATDYTLNSTIGRLGVNTSVMQRRVQNCSAGEAIREIARDGTVACETDDIGAGGGAWTTLGPGLNDTGVILDANTTYLQRRVQNCSAGEAIREISRSGNVVCETDTDTQLSQSQVWNYMNVSKFFLFLSSYFDSEANLTGLLDDNYVSRNTWTDIDSYPAACAAGTAVTAIGDTLTCADYYDATDDQADDCTEVNACTIDAESVEGTDTGTLTNGYYCTYDSAGTEIDCNVQYAIATDTDCTASQILLGDGSCADNYDATDDSAGDCTEVNACTIDAESMEGTDWGTMTNTYYCTYDSGGTEVDCNTQYTTATDTDCTTQQYLDGDGNCDTGYLDADGADDDTPDSDAEILDDITIDSSGKGIKIDDNDKVYFGTGNDACIFYNGTTLIIDGSC